MSEENASQTNTEDVDQAPENQESEGNNSESNEDAQQAQEKKQQDLFYGDKKDEEESSDEKSDEDNEPEDESDSKEAEDEDEDEDYELKPLEETKLSDADMERIAAYAKEQGLSKEAAQKLVEQESEARDSYFEDLQSQHKRMVGQWVEDVKSDKEIGGDNYKKNVELARRVAHKFGTQKFLDNLDATGYGNNPEVVRVFARIGRSMSSDSLVKSGVKSGGDTSMEDIFYGNKN